MSVRIDKEALEHAAIYALDLMSRGWDSGELSSQDITERIVGSYLRKKAELDGESEGDGDVVTRHVHPPIPDRRWDWCAYRKGEEEAGNYGWGRTAQEALNELEAMYEAEGA